MTLRGWMGAFPLCALLLAGQGCGDEEGSEGEDAAVADGGDETQDDASTAEDAAEPPPSDDATVDTRDGGAPEAGQDAGDASSSSDGGAAALDEDGFPILPVGMSNAIFLSVTNSSSQTLPDGLYQAPFSPNASSGSTLSYLDTSFIFTMKPSLQVQMNLKRMMQDGSFECVVGSELLVRFGEPPSGSNQLLTKSCSVTYRYDASKTEYTGTFEAVMGDGLTNASEEATADVSARFAVIGSNK
jgi:hypothetical protein